ncbi:YodL domain-containing protein [Cytobacillus sp. FJAT-54145]|uniref:YodL domain-containing protein n=1 Tax=Cytobacillus spartinae TaxID=3299023 RepID=A0ABW6KD23_9BACI
MLKEWTRSRRKSFDVTIFQTAEFKQKKGFKQVYRVIIEGHSREDCLNQVFKKFNVPDRIPNDYVGRFISTGDIVHIDQGREGQFYYQLRPEGWKRINRIHIR